MSLLRSSSFYGFVSTNISLLTELVTDDSKELQLSHLDEQTAPSDFNILICLLDL